MAVRTTTRAGACSGSFLFEQLSAKVMGANMVLHNCRRYSPIVSQNRKSVPDRGASLRNRLPWLALALARDELHAICGERAAPCPESRSFFHVVGTCGGGRHP